jgi:sugar (pentulose or hexulose) kinase
LAVAVLDVGKTNVKLALVDAGGHVTAALAHPNAVRPGPPWRHHDLAGTARWLVGALRELGRDHPIGALVPVGHGSGGVLVTGDPEAGDGTGAALPMIDYEEPCPPAVDAAYRARAGSFADRGSAVMMASTHAARQLWRMQSEAPQAVAGARWFLNVAQYWGWWLTGTAASEMTAMGAQSHFWNVPERRWSPIVEAEGWERLMPPFRRADAPLGTLRATLAEATGLPGLTVLTGAHDSSANFHLWRAAGLGDFTLVSTGTWIVALSAGADPARLDEARGMTINADIDGRPVGGALAMGGREFSAIAGPEWRGAAAEVEAIRRLVARGTMARPSFGANDGQFPGSAGKGAIAGPPPEGQEERTALAVLHAALLTLACGEALGGGSRWILDGTFLREPLFAPLVAALRPGLPTEVSAEPEGVAAGAALLARPAARPAALFPARPLDVPGLADYARRWRALAEGVGP